MNQMLHRSWLILLQAVTSDKVICTTVIYSSTFTLCVAVNILSACYIV